ncbi:MAG: flagellar basal body rod protein FlgB [Armatimonadota bacterium]
MESIFGDATYEYLSRVLDVCAVRHRIIANNIANAETPGFRRRELNFEEALRAVREGELGDALHRLVSEDPSPGRADGNNVCIDTESALLAENAMTYEAVATMLDLRSQWLASALGEGGR